MWRAERHNEPVSLGGAPQCGEGDQSKTPLSTSSSMEGGWHGCGVLVARPELEGLC